MEEENWLFMKKKQNEIGDHLRKAKSQGTVTIENREDKFVMMAMMPKEGKLKIHSDDIPLCKHILG